MIGGLSLVFVFILEVILFLGAQKKQALVSRSSTEVEYRSLAHATAEIVAEVSITGAGNYIT